MPPKKTKKPSSPKKPSLAVEEEPSTTTGLPLPETYDTDEEPRGRRQHGASHALDPIDDEAAAGDETVDVESGVVGGHGGDASP